MDTIKGIALIGTFIGFLITFAMGFTCSAFADDLCENKYRPPFGEPGDVEECRVEQEAGKKFVWDWLGKNGVKSLDQLAKQKGELISFVARFCVKPEEGDGQDWAVAAYCLKR